MSTYEPATVALVTFQADDMVKSNTLRGIRWAAGWHVADSRGCYEVVHDRWVSDVRPLVVLELPRGAYAGWPVLVNALREAKEKTLLHVTFGDLIAQIEAQTKPPKPAEPTGLGAVVVDSLGDKWVNSGGRTERPWFRPALPKSASWSDVDVVDVLSPGVTS